MKRFGWFMVTLAGAVVTCAGALSGWWLATGDSFDPFLLLLLASAVPFTVVVLVVALPLLRLPPEAALGPGGVWIPERPTDRRLMWVPWDQVDRVDLRRRGLTRELRVWVRGSGGAVTRTASLWGVDRTPAEIEAAMVRFAGEQRARPPTPRQPDH